MSNLREYSKINYRKRSEIITEGEINIGSLQRIADAIEKVAGNYVALQNERDLYARWYKEEKEKTKRLYNSIRSLKGAKTKLRKKLGGVACEKVGKW